MFAYLYRLEFPIRHGPVMCSFLQNIEFSQVSKVIPSLNDVIPGFVT